MSNAKEQFEKKFRALATQIGCDKVLNHSYESGYAKILWDRQNDPIKILEIGIGGEGYADGGHSLFLWKNLFPKAEVFGLDIFDKSKLDSERVRTFIVDQNDIDKLTDFAQKYGPFDIVIDDGSHHRADVLTSIFVLMPYVSEGGYYIIEDISTSYWPVYGGSTISNGFQDSPIDWVKKSIDIVHRGDLLFENNNLPNWNLRSITSYSGLAFFEIGQPRIAKNIPESSGFYENQRETDIARYGKYREILSGFYKDPLGTIAPLINK